MRLLMQMCVFVFLVKKFTRKCLKICIFSFEDNDLWFLYYWYPGPFYWSVVLFFLLYLTLFHKQKLFCQLYKTMVLRVKRFCCFQQKSLTFFNPVSDMYCVIFFSVGDVTLSVFHTLCKSISCFAGCPHILFTSQKDHWSFISVSYSFFPLPVYLSFSFEVVHSKGLFNRNWRDSVLYSSSSIYV